jgi:hypothetical protein
LSLWTCQNVFDNRPKLLPDYSKLPKSREFIQPQWLLDCANFNFVLPIKRNEIGVSLPPRLNPWVDDKHEVYVPKKKEKVKKLRNGELLDFGSDYEHTPVVETASLGQEEDQSDLSSKKESESLSTPELWRDIEVGDDDSKDESECSEEDNDGVQEANRKARKKMLSEVSKVGVLYIRFILFRRRSNSLCVQRKNRMRRWLGFPRPSCRKRPRISMRKCSMKLLKNRPRLTVDRK